MFTDRNTENVYSIYEINDKSSNKSGQIIFREERIEILCNTFFVGCSLSFKINGSDFDNKAKIKKKKVALGGIFWGVFGGQTTHLGGSAGPS